MFAKKSDKLEMVLGEHSKIAGDVESSGTVLVEGTILGNVKGEKVILGEKAYVKGDISANDIIVAGRIEGRLLGTESVEIKATARIFGDLITKSLSVVSGAHFNGLCSMDACGQGLAADAEKNVVEFAAKER